MTKIDRAHACSVRLLKNGYQARYGSGDGAHLAWFRDMGDALEHLAEMHRRSTVHECAVLPFRPRS